MSHVCSQAPLKSLSPLCTAHPLHCLLPFHFLFCLVNFLLICISTKLEGNKGKGIKYLNRAFILAKKDMEPSHLVCMEDFVGASCLFQFFTKWLPSEPLIMPNYISQWKQGTHWHTGWSNIKNTASHLDVLMNKYFINKIYFHLPNIWNIYMMLQTRIFLKQMLCYFTFLYYKDRKP